MTIIPSRLAVKTATSSSFFEARQKVLHLYRDWQRAAPKTASLFFLNIPVSAIRAKIREEFEKNRYVTDLGVIDILIFKGRSEYEETLNGWKMETHVMRYFSKEEAQTQTPKPYSFLEKFYGKFDDGSIDK
ncbi:11822_t:CDS:2 [Entrophospora sp. SA101]|nr:13595_t:CDS:2 [Entrophospora sp. SA101]CAJ0755941.1 11822_t:CDS:2 [Entrophospora sp. SA101]CAJ0852326.1 14891_t:CDS:2 [Entrophospora sp. SA101]CAJ0882122.1 3457_t:CDS:2 [Entrophospora sp. SA101]